MNYNYINQIKQNYLNRYEFLNDKLKNNPHVCIRCFYDETNDISEGFLQYDGKDFMFITFNEEGTDMAIKVPKVKAKELIDKATFNDLFVLEKNEDSVYSAKLYYEKSKKIENNETFSSEINRLIGEDNNDNKDRKLSERFDNSKFLEDYLSFNEMEPYDLSFKNIHNTYYKFSFTDNSDESKEPIERTFLVFPELNYALKDNVYDKSKILGYEKMYDKGMHFGTELDSSLNYGCIITEIVDGSPDFVNSESISLDELNIIITGQILDGKNVEPFKDTLATKLLRKYLVVNEGNSGEKIIENSLLRGVSFYIDDETGQYIVNIENKRGNSSSRIYNSFEEFESDKELLHTLENIDYKKDSVNAELLNYIEAERVLSNKIIRNEKEFLEMVSSHSKFMETLDSDKAELCYFSQYFCDVKEFLDNRDYLSKLKLPLSSGEESYFEKFLKKKGFELEKIPTGQVQNFIQEVLIEDNLIFRDKTGNDKFQNINVIYGLYGLDSNEIIDKINALGVNFSNDDVRKVFIEDFDDKFWKQRISYLSTIKEEDGKEYYIDSIRGLSKEDAFLKFAELSFYKAMSNPEVSEFYKMESEKIDLDKMFSDNSLIYSDVNINKDNKNIDNYYASSHTAYLDSLDMENDNNTFKRKSQLLKISSSELNENLLRENFDEIRNSNDYNILLRYIQSSIRYDDVTKELDSIVKKYEKDVEIYGKETALGALENYLSKTIIDENNEVSSIFDRVFNENKKNLNAFFEYDSLDFTTIMKKTLINLDENDNNLISFDIWDGLGTCKIEKTESNLYKVTINCEDDLRSQVYDLNKTLNILNYTNEEGVELIPQKDKEKLIEDLKDEILSSFAGEIIEANYADSAILDSDSQGTKIQKILAGGDAVILRKNMERTRDVEFVMLQKTEDNKIIKKSVEVLHTNKRAAEINLKNFSRYVETPIKNGVERDYFATNSKYPDISIKTEILSSKELTDFIKDDIYLRAWDVERSDYHLDKLNSKEVRIDTDKTVFNLARTSSMTDEEKRVFVLNEKIKNHLMNSDGAYESCAYANVNTKTELDGSIVTEKEIISIEASDGRSSEGLSKKEFDVNIIRIINVKNPDGEEVTCPMVQRLEKAIYVDSNGDLSIEPDCKRSMERVLDNIFENRLDTDSCSQYFRDNADKKKSVSDGISYSASIIDTYTKHYKGFDSLREVCNINEFDPQSFKCSFEELMQKEGIKELLEDLEKDPVFKNYLNDSINENKNREQNKENDDKIISDAKIRGLFEIHKVYESCLEVLKEDKINSLLGEHDNLGTLLARLEQNNENDVTKEIVGSTEKQDNQPSLSEHQIDKVIVEIGH